MNKFSIAMVALVSMAGLAAAGDSKTDPKAAPKGDMKGDAKAAAPKADAKAAAPMAMPKPAQEIADMVKGLSGSWKCDGTAMGADMKEGKFKGTMKTKSDLDGFWVHDSMEGTMGEGKGAMNFKMESYSTYDASSKKWRRAAVMNDGGMMVGTSDGMKDMKMEMTLDTWDSHGQGMFKDNVDASDMKKGVHAWGQMSMDKGKTWNKVYDMTCKK
jgi:hypothetical protein